MKHIVMYLTSALFFLLVITQLKAQSEQKKSQDELISAAREIMLEARYCALITLDATGRPNVRTMDPFPPEDDMLVWLGTNSRSRKVREIRKDQRVSLYYVLAEGGGYVTVIGKAELVDDAAMKSKYWKEKWSEFYPKPEEMYLLIKVEPERLEVVSYKHGITGESGTWKVPVVKFE